MIVGEGVVVDELVGTDGVVLTKDVDEEALDVTVDAVLDNEDGEESAVGETKVDDRRVVEKIVGDGVLV